MSIFQFGSVIRMRREELSLTQEDLADGICAVTTLSRIENGERMPTQNHLEMLMQRLGYSDTLVDSFVSEHEFRAHQLKYQIRQNFITGCTEQSRALLDEFKKLNPNPTQISCQFILLHEVLLYPERYSAEERLAKLEEAMKLTCPNYQSGKMPQALTYEEIILLNNIAVCNAQFGNRRSAIILLYRLKEYYETKIVNVEEALRTQAMTLYNLSKMLGLEGRYDECIEVCDCGIKLAQKTGRCQLFSKTLFNRAWALLKRGADGDLEKAKYSAERALQMANIMEQEKLEKIIADFISENLS